MPASTTTHPAIIKAQELYDATDADGELRDLELHEQEFVTAVSRIRTECAQTKGVAAREFGDGSQAHSAVVFLANNSERDHLTRALEAFERANNPADDDATDLAQAAE